MLNNQKKYVGTVISISGNKTIKVSTTRRKAHSIYRKVITLSKASIVHDENNEAKVGDIVEFYECRPISSTKKWRLAGIKKSVL